MVEISREGVLFGVMIKESNFLAIKVSFRINKSGFLELTAEFVTVSLLGRPNFITSYNRTAIYLKFCTFLLFIVLCQ